MSGGGTRWEKAAEAYATGEHKSGRELELVVEFAAPTGRERVLDIGTGAGHTALALAPRVSSVVVTDPVDAMLATARRLFQEAGLSNAEFVRASAERLPFAVASFDIVTTRLAAHHFDDVALAMREVARVLRPGGIFIFIDSLAPEDPQSAAYQDEVETLRDPTHRRIYTQREWIAFCEQARFRTEKTEVVRKAHDFEPWLERGGEDAATQQRVRARFLEAPASAVRDLEIVVADGQVKSFTDRKLVLAARR
ncbi:MAG TPA: class I SAM-dependent methyltransferase [Candidatus Dormibacteraeota bacterium]|nr:class I SAM-dependent methyltransferase [Candidatus Dormibacteraeota bacterium]